MSKIANKQMICEVLMEAAKTDKDIVALCSDSRGSGSFTPFAETYPDQFVETGIAEQNLVSISAGLAKCGKLTVEEHAPFGGLGSMVSQVVGSECPRKVVNMSLPDAPVITGTSREVFDYYGLNAEGIAKKAAELVK